MFEHLPAFLYRPIINLTEGWPWLGNRLNAVAINGLVNASRHRPHPWSTAHDYVSWTSLTDQRWMARHLPAAAPTDRPPIEEVVRLFQRGTDGQRFCPKSTCLFPTFAQYLTDGFIRTRMNTSEEPATLRLQNTSNHQIDLCPLYGRTLEQTAVLRLNSEKPGERGRLKSQYLGAEEYAPFLCREDGTVQPEFVSLDPPLGLKDDDPVERRARIFAFGGDRANAVPQVAMLNTLFLREHNRLAGEIERANPGWDDERVFHTARNTVIVLFITIVVEEYINHVSPAPIRFKADPEVAWDAPWNKPNWVTTEFSLLYRWHSLVPDQISWNGKIRPIHETFLNNGPLLEVGLRQGFAEISGQRAARLGPFNTALPLLGVEQRAVEQDRLCRLQPYNKYRRYVSKPEARDFSEVSHDPQVTSLLQQVYGDVSKLEFYPGLFAEDAVRNSPLPPLILAMVAVDAFSQALTNPLLSRHVFNVATFSSPGWDAIHSNHSLRDLLERNAPGNPVWVSMTQAQWKYQ